MMNIQFRDNVKARVINKFQNNKYRKNKSRLVRAQYEIYDYIKSINSESEDKLKVKT